MATRGGLSALALSEVALGVVLAWSGVANASLAAAARSLLRGQPPQPGTGAQPIAAPPSSPAPPGQPPPASTSAIAAAAERYNGHAYRFGGAPGPDGSQPWDCSDFASWVLGHDLGFTLPGGSWAKVTDNGRIHGPTTISYLSWDGAQTVGHSWHSAQPGDLLVWQTHMGFCTGQNQMISAQDEQLGTGYSVIGGAIPGELLFVRRVVLGSPGA